MGPPGVAAAVVLRQGVQVQCHLRWDGWGEHIRLLPLLPSQTPTSWRLSTERRLPAWDRPSTGRWAASGCGQDDGERNSCNQKCPRKLSSLERQIKSLFTPAWDEFTCSPSQLGAWRGSRRSVKKNGEAGTSIHEKTPVGQLVNDVYQWARDHGVKVSLAV